MLNIFSTAGIGGFLKYNRMKDFRPISIYELFTSITYYIKYYYHDILTTSFMILRFINNFFSSWIIFILFPILYVPKNLVIPFQIFWLLINILLLIFILKKMNLIKKEIGFHVILLPISLFLLTPSPIIYIIPFFPILFSIALIYLVILFGRIIVRIFNKPKK